MWMFDEGKKLSKEEVVQYANEGGEDAIRNFPEVVLNDAELMLHLIKNCYRSTGLIYASDELKSNLSFLKDVADCWSYTDQESFLRIIPEELQRNSEILGIFAAKADDPMVKEASIQAKKLNKLLSIDGEVSRKRRIQL